MSEIHDVVRGKQPELRALCVKYRVALLAVFGSAATGRFVNATSDLDFLVEFQPMAAVDRAASYFGLLESLEALFARPIDLVESSAIRNPYFRASVDETRVDLYAAA
ncbi:MAG: nucleotidyltransferase family protein [bacterium]